MSEAEGNIKDMNTMQLTIRSCTIFKYGLGLEIDFVQTCWCKAAGTWWSPWYTQFKRESQCQEEVGRKIAERWNKFLLLFEYVWTYRPNCLQVLNSDNRSWFLASSSIPYLRRESSHGHIKKHHETPWWKPYEKDMKHHDIDDHPLFWLCIGQIWT